jgi:hypothetical protein
LTTFGHTFVFSTRGNPAAIHGVPQCASLAMGADGERLPGGTAGSFGAPSRPPNGENQALAIAVEIRKSKTGSRVASDDRDIVTVAQVTRMTEVGRDHDYDCVTVAQVTRMWRSRGISRRCLADAVERKWRLLGGSLGQERAVACTIFQ